MCHGVDLGFAYKIKDSDSPFTMLKASGKLSYTPSLHITSTVS